MKTPPLFTVAKILSLASVVFFTACNEAEDPMPNEPNAQDTTITPNTSGLPDGGNLPGGGTGGNGNGPLGGGKNQPTNNSVIGTLSAAGSDYEYTMFGYQANRQANEDGTYPVTLIYADEESVKDELELFDTGNTALFIYNAAQAGVIEPGNYQLSDSPFSGLFFGIQGYGYLLADGTISVETTQTNGQLLINITGNVVEVEQDDDDNLSVVSQDLIPIEAQFAAPAKNDVNARQAAGLTIAPEIISLKLSK